MLLKSKINIRRLRSAQLSEKSALCDPMRQPCAVPVAAVIRLSHQITRVLEFRTIPHRAILVVLDELCIPAVPLYSSANPQEFESVRQRYKRPTRAPSSSPSSLLHATAISLLLLSSSHFLKDLR